MARRTITDEEIALIKAMLLRSMKNRDIQFYFNRQDRPVNSGRITQIRDRTYGPDVPTAADEALNAFLAGFTPATIGAVVQQARTRPEPSATERAAAMFERRGRLGWFLKSHEDEATECKETFCLKPEGRFADPLRSIAGLANNGGGFVFFGVKELPDGSLHAVGLADRAFLNTDPAELNRCLVGVLAPVPVLTIFAVELDEVVIGAIHIERHEYLPVIAIKNINNEVKEGAIYYRYVGETRVIKPAELLQIIAYREQRAVAEFARRMSHVAIGSAATLDLDTGKVDGKSGSFVIDEALLPKLQFIRHGQFEENAGAPTLRLVGEVSVADPVQLRTIRNNVTNESVLLNFLKEERVEHPLQYVLHAAHTGRRWLPLFYFVHLGSQPIESVAASLRGEDASYRLNRAIVLKRLDGSHSGAFRIASGRAKDAIARVLDGSLSAPVDLYDVQLISGAIQALDDESQVDFGLLKASLLSCYQLTRDHADNSNIRSQVYRAACRIDEMEYEGKARSK